MTQAASYFFPEFRFEKNIFIDAARRVPFWLSARTDDFQMFWQQ